MMASSKLAIFTIVFGVAYAVIYVICTEMNLPLLTCGLGFGMPSVGSFARLQ